MVVGIISTEWHDFDHFDALEEMVIGDVGLYWANNYSTNDINEHYHENFGKML